MSVCAFFPNLTFQAHMALIDPKGGRLVLTRSPLEAANAAVLARPRCTFHCEMAGWHVEFVAAEPRAVTVRRQSLIQCRFPELLASNPRRSPEPPTLTEIVAVANYLAEHSDVACNDADFYSKAPSFGSLSVDKATFDWLIRAGDVDIRLLMLAFGV